MCLRKIWSRRFLDSPHHLLDGFWGPQDGFFVFSSGGYRERGAKLVLKLKDQKIKTERTKLTDIRVFCLDEHPSLDNPQKKNQKTHLGDPKIHQVYGVGHPKTFGTKSSEGRFFFKSIFKKIKIINDIWQNPTFSLHTF